MQCGGGAASLPPWVASPEGKKATCSTFGVFTVCFTALREICTGQDVLRVPPQTPFRVSRVRGCHRAGWIILYCLLSATGSPAKDVRQLVWQLNFKSNTDLS